MYGTVQTKRLSLTVLVCIPGYLKTLVEAKVKVSACRLDLQGWKRPPGPDSTILRLLHLPRITSLVVVIQDATPDGAFASEE